MYSAVEDVAHATCMSLITQGGHCRRRTTLSMHNAIHRSAVGHVMATSMNEATFLGGRMKKFATLFLGLLGLTSTACAAQQTSTQIPDAPTPSMTRPAPPDYSPPTQRERFKSYIRQTYRLKSIVEAGAHAGIAQARDNPSEWPQGAEGYGDRFGSAYGETVVRGTTEYALADLFREDVRHIRSRGLLYLPYCQPICRQRRRCQYVVSSWLRKGKHS